MSVILYIYMSSFSLFSAREKSAWVSFFAVVLTWPFFFYSAMSGQTAISQTLPGFIAGLLSVMAAELILDTVLNAIVNREKKPEKDERDRAIELMSLRNAYYAMPTAAAIIFFGPSITYFNQAYLGIAQLFLLCFITAEMVKYLSQMIYYRRGV